MARTFDGNSDPNSQASAPDSTTVTPLSACYLSSFRCKPTDSCYS